jgi:hypothetical protein
VKVRVAPGISFFEVGGPSYSAWSGGAIYNMGCMVPQPFAAGGNQSYQEFWAVTGDPWHRDTRFVQISAREGRRWDKTLLEDEVVAGSSSWLNGKKV